MSRDFPDDYPGQVSGLPVAFGGPARPPTTVFGLSATGTAEVRTADGELANNPSQDKEDQNG